MSRPRGKGVQRRLAELAKSILEPAGCECHLDFSRRGGHQQLLVAMPTGEEVSIEISSSPRDEGNALTFMRQKCQRLVRDIQNKGGA